SLLDVQIATLANQGMNYLASGRNPKRQGNAHPNIVPYQAFATRDGHVVVAVGNDAQFSRFVSILGLGELADDPRYGKNTDRVLTGGFWLELLTEKIRLLGKGALLAALDAQSIPAGPINELHEVFADPHVVSRGLVIEQNLSSGGGTARVIGNPV